MTAAWRFSSVFQRWSEEPIDADVATHLLKALWGTREFGWNFRDNLVKDAAGNSELDCWEGKAGNNSPKFSFGKAEQARIQRLVTTQHFDSVFLDFYDQATGSDFGRGYAHLPFYPLQVAQMEYAKALADWLHGQGKVFVVNGPDVSFPVHQFADVIWHDMGDRVKFGIWQKMFIGYRLAVALLSAPGNRYGVDDIAKMNEVGLFNGFCVTWFQIAADAKQLSPDDFAQASRLLKESFPVTWEIGRSRLVAGAPLEHYVFRHTDGHVFITLRNESAKPLKRPVRVKLRWLGMEPNRPHAVRTWTLRGGWQSVVQVKGRQLEDGWLLPVGKGETKVILLTSPSVQPMWVK